MAPFYLTRAATTNPVSKSTKMPAHALSNFDLNNLVQEHSHLDYKLMCNAFTGDTKTNAELVKDVCAMANNGNAVSHIVIGIADDRSQFKSFANQKFNEARLQDLVSKHIYPAPRVALRREEAIAPDGTAVTLGVVSIGPNKRTVHRIVLELGERLRNEIWVRRGSVCGLASPEEVRSLLKGEGLGAPAGIALDTYARLPLADRRESMVRDLTAVHDRIAYFDEHQLLRVALDSRDAYYRVVWADDLGRGGYAAADATVFWGFEDGVVILSNSRLPKGYFRHPEFPALEVVSKERWGHYAIVPVYGSGELASPSGFSWPGFGKSVRNGPQLAFPLIVFDGLQGTVDTARRMSELYGFLSDPQVATRHDAMASDILESLYAVTLDERVLLYGLLSFHVPPSGNGYEGRPDLVCDSARFGESPVCHIAEHWSYQEAVNFALLLRSGFDMQHAPRTRAPGEVVTYSAYCGGSYTAPVQLSSSLRAVSPAWHVSRSMTPSLREVLAEALGEECLDKALHHGVIGLAGGTRRRR